MTFKEKKVYLSKNFLDKDLSFSKNNFLDHLRGLNVKNNSVNKEEFRKAIVECERETYFTNEYLLCSGHDLMNILSYGLLLT
jgi:hypothetical protein